MIRRGKTLAEKYAEKKKDKPLTAAQQRKVEQLRQNITRRSRKHDLANIPDGVETR